MTKTLIIHTETKQNPRNLPASYGRTVQSKLEEAEGLAHAISLDICKSEIVNINKIAPSTHIGKGKVEEYASYVKAESIDLVIINTDISPIQQRNLETALNCKVIDRTALILEIFGERAQTKEGSLQVELASLEYQKSRLVRSWTHLERQRGGGGFLGGPGETQIESDRRAINTRINNIKGHLKKVVKTRDLHRKSRKKVPYPIVALVGYTNAGKSTLFNYITKSDVFAQDALFATLDPTMRLIELPSKDKIIMSDTVGFISELPTQLVAAFRATLEEVIEADIILHVRDISHQDTESQKQDVIDIVTSLGVEEKIMKSAIEVLNKIDLLDDEYRQNLIDKSSNKLEIACISAVSGQGVEDLLESIAKMVTAEHLTKEVVLDIKDGQILAWIYKNSEVISRHDDEYSIKLSIKISAKDFGRLNKMMQKD
ncbi:GTPase HflX [Rickettsiales bacterium]|nr:GTPase HflX [Rickettsiales bacterium]